jgi:1,2-dihydroxy-3-keto-5-methylthiopentene dioxygenase
MAVLRISGVRIELFRKSCRSADYLGQIGIEYDVWQPVTSPAADASQDEILQAYSAEIDKLKERAAATSLPMINVNPQTPNLDTMLAKFSREHWHDEDEVRSSFRDAVCFISIPKRRLWLQSKSSPAT